MKTTLLSTAFFVVLAIRVHAQSPGIPATDPHWKLVWEDNFNTLDNSKWTVIDYADGNMQIVHMADHVNVSNGKLEIKITNQSFTCPTNPPTVSGARIPCLIGHVYPYRSGWVETTQAYNTQYGYIEARVSNPYGYGIGSAFWTYIGPGVPRTNAAEIDIYEMLSYAKVRKIPPVIPPEPQNPQIVPSTMISTGIHLDGCQSGTTPVFDCEELPLGSSNCPGHVCHGQYVSIPSSYANTYHIYGLKWNPWVIEWYFNNTLIRSYPNPGVVDPVRTILSLHVPEGYPPNGSTPFPSYMHVDYVRVYDLDFDCGTALNACSYNLSTHDNKVKKSITIGGSGCTNTLNQGNDLTLRAKDFVSINGTFSVPLGSELYIAVNSCY